MKEPYLDYPLVGHIVSLLAQSASTEGEGTGSEHRDTAGTQEYSVF